MNKKRLLSPIGLLALAACGERGAFISEGVAIKGPLANALVFADANGDGIFNPGETSVRTDADGNFSLENPNKYTVVVVADEQTTNALTGEATGTFVMTGAAEDTVITAFSTLQQADLSDEKVQELAESLGLPTGFDFVNENPFAADSGLTDEEKLAFEQAASQMMATLQVTAAAVQAEAGDGALSDEEAFNLAFDAMAEEVSDRLDAGDVVDFEDTEFLSEVVTETAALAAAQTGQASIDVDAEQVATVVAVVNGQISEVESLDDTDALAEALAAGRKTAETVQESGNFEAINLRPLSLKLVEAGTTDQVTEIDDDMVGGESLGVMLVVDDDEVAEYTFEIVGGVDAAAFEIDESTGDLKLAAGYDPDALSDGQLDVIVRVTETENTALTRDVALSIDVNNVDEGPTVFAMSAETGTDTGEVYFGTAVSILGSASDVDGVASLSYEFSVDGRVVQSGTSNSYVPTWEWGEAYQGDVLSFVVIATDETGAVTRSASQDIGGIFVGPNAAPVFYNYATRFYVYEEDNPTGTTIGSVEAWDDRDADLTYELVMAEGEADLFELVPDGYGGVEIRVKPGVSFDFETQSTYQASVVASDGVNETVRAI